LTEEEDARGSAVAVLERVVVGKPEVQEDRANHRVNESLCVFPLVCEVAKEPQPLGQLLGGRRAVDRLTVVAVEYRDPFFPGTLKTSGGRGVVERPRGHDPVQLQDRLRAQARADVLPHELQGAEVVDDHPLASVFRRSAAAQQLLGDLPRRGGALELARTDRLLHQGIDEVALPRAALGGDHVLHRDLTAAMPIDRAKALQHQVG